MIDIICDIIVIGGIAVLYGVMTYHMIWGEKFKELGEPYEDFRK